ncbi:RHS repeat domain-containing protein [Pseudomonas sp. GV085]|uniref:RHS repeat domain-containing protein n=1 Tax=Pseudomonas sp. GV085 TaxID=2135756 RepID=UPI000D4B0D1B|nr:RHS repeat-associated core domain-containing protein [Pseudomonas sp. GV085]PTR29255.1 insecticidal toxin complex protein TccC [Pseudomonas sp. GV085]
MPATLSIHRHTPTLIAIDPRGLAVRAVGYWRDIDDVPPQARVNRTVHDGAGRAITQWDPRLFLDASAPANLQTNYALSGAALSTDSVDAGWRVALLGEAGQAVHSWDGRGSQRWLRYDAQMRPESVFEQAMDGEALCAERLSYGASGPTFAERNQCGQLIRHDDPAGTQQFTEFGLHGTVLEQTRHFLQALSLPDWPEPVAERELLLEPGESAITHSHFNAMGEVSHQTDAKGHRQLFSQTLDGQLRAVRLQLNGASTPKTLVSAIAYNAPGQTEREVVGNGVITTQEYDAQNGRLIRLQALRGNEALQDLRYTYDPVGNVLSIEDAAQPIRYFANQRIEPVNRYGYDSLSQLIEATGWEAGGANKGPQFSAFDDPAPRANYRQTYHYDTGSNLLELTHEGPQSHGHRLVAAAHSNRCLPVLEGIEPGEDDFRHGFDRNGNLLNLQLGQALAWDLRNQLSEVRPVERDSGLNDRERYVYGADGMRLRKVRETLTHARTLIAETRYLPNLELRNYNGTGEVLQVISVQTGRSTVRVLHWESAPPKDSANDQYRYQLNDHLGSRTLELDDDGEVISQERYHPYGTTAWFGGRGEAEASYRTVRYSGKEQDATGLYYYGFRYYMAAWQRWLNPDPAGEVDGINLYVMVTNNPVNRIDIDGLKPFLFGVKNEVENARKESINYAEAAVEVLRNGGSVAIQNVMIKYFNDASPQRIARWSADLLKVIDVAKSTKIHRNLELIGDDYEGGMYKKAVAMVDGKEYSEFKIYTDSVGRTLRNFADNKKELAEQLKEKKTQYKAERNKKFLRVNEKNWKVVKDLRGVVDLVLTMIHEFSHVALGTEDYVYKKILEGKNHAPLFDLAVGRPSADSRLPALNDLITSAGGSLNFSDVAYANADSFAAATVALIEESGGVKSIRSGKSNLIAPKIYK